MYVCTAYGLLAATLAPTRLAYFPTKHVLRASEVLQRLYQSRSIQQDSDRYLITERSPAFQPIKGHFTDTVYTH